jgi:lysozyme
MIFQKGDTGYYVTLIQKALGIKADGVFGPKTAAAVISFQSSHGLTADGIVGPLTIAALQNKVTPPANVPPGVPHSGSGTLQGLDIYHFDDVLSWSAIAKNFSFVIIKALQGLSRPDPLFSSYWHGAKQAGLVVGGYHFMEWNSGSGAEQARRFYARLQSVGYGKDDLPPACDWEFSPERDPRPSDLPIGKEFLEEIAQLTGRKPIIYLSASRPAEYGNPSWMKNYYLWLASYRNSPAIPALWGDYDFWQNSESASLAGIREPGDHDFFNGDLARLKSL